MRLVDAADLPLALNAFDTVIIGGGFAGIFTALRLARRRRVLILSGGRGSEEHPEATALTAMSASGHYWGGYWRGHWIRAFGGTSRRWQAWSRAPDTVDFTPLTRRPAAWPIEKRDLAPYFAEAAGLLGVDENIANTEAPLARGVARRSIHVPRGAMGPAQLADLIAGAPNIAVAHDVTVTRLLANEDRTTVTGLDAWRFDGARITLPTEGKLVVLAAGGMGNAHILMQPADAGPPVGNETGQVGRYLMEHPHVYAAGHVILRPDLAEWVVASTGSPAKACIGLTPQRRAAEDVLDASLQINPGSAAAKSHPNVGDGVVFDYTVRAEMAPNADNQITLTASRNAAGQFAMDVRCFVGADDLASIADTVRIVGVDLAKAGAGAIRLDSYKLVSELTGGGHTMGTTRMGADRSNSVCDAAGRVHGYGNLMAAGSSLFPNGTGAANPTWTLCAVALRNGDLALEAGL